MATVASPSVEMFYWVTIMFSQTSGPRWKTGWPTPGPRLPGRGAGLFRRSGCCRRRVLLHRDIPHPLVLGRIHTHPSPRRGARGLPRQAGEPWRHGDQPLCRLGGHRGGHSRPHSPAAATRRRASRRPRTGRVVKTAARCDRRGFRGAAVSVMGGPSRDKPEHHDSAFCQGICRAASTVALTAALTARCAVPRRLPQVASPISTPAFSTLAARSRATSITSAPSSGRR